MTLDAAELFLTLEGTALSEEGEHTVTYSMALDLYPDWTPVEMTSTIFISGDCTSKGLTLVDPENTSPMMDIISSVGAASTTREVRAYESLVDINIQQNFGLDYAPCGFATPELMMADESDLPSFLSFSVNEANDGTGTVTVDTPEDTDEGLYELLLRYTLPGAQNRRML